MARHGSRVQLEQCDMCLGLNMGHMAKGGFLRAAIGQRRIPNKKPRAKVRDEKKWGVEFPGHRKVNAAMERHPVMVCENQTDGFLPCPTGTAKYPRIRWLGKRKGASPEELAPHTRGTPPVTSSDNVGADSSRIEGVPPGHVYIHTPLPNAHVFDSDANVKDCTQDKDFIPDLLTDEGTSTA